MNVLKVVCQPGVIRHPWQTAFVLTVLVSCCRRSTASSSQQAGQHALTSCSRAPQPSRRCIKPSWRTTHALHEASSSPPQAWPSNTASAVVPGAPRCANSDRRAAFHPAQDRGARCDQLQFVNGFAPLGELNVARGTSRTRASGADHLSWRSAKLPHCQCGCMHVSLMVIMRIASLVLVQG